MYYFYPSDVLSISHRSCLLLLIFTIYSDEKPKSCVEKFRTICEARKASCETVKIVKQQCPITCGVCKGNAHVFTKLNYCYSDNKFNYNYVYILIELHVHIYLFNHVKYSISFGAIFYYIFSLLYSQTRTQVFRKSRNVETISVTVFVAELSASVHATRTYEG